MPKRERRRSHPTLEPSGGVMAGNTGALGCQSNGALNTPRAQRSQGIDELIHFVRNCQGGGLKRESTEIRLQRKAPLPDIGHTNGAYPAGLAPDMSHPCSLIPDNHPSLQGVHAMSSSLDTETTDTDHAYESDLEPELEFQPRVRTPSPPLPQASMPPGIDRPASMLGQVVHNPATLSTSLEGIPESAPVHRTKLRPFHKVEPLGRRATAGVHHLPPVVLDQPERPSAPGLSPRGAAAGPLRPDAPSPSVTPPLPDDDSLSTPVAYDEPIEYLDLH